MLFISWKEAVEVKDDEEFCMMKQLIEKFPEVAKVLRYKNLHLHNIANHFQFICCQMLVLNFGF